MRQGCSRESSGWRRLVGCEPLECRAASRPGGTHNFTLYSFQFFSLEEKLQGKLHQARVASLSDLAELAAIATVSIGIEKLGMVEKVEYLAPKINPLRFRYMEALEHCKVRVADVRAAADGSRGISDPAKQAWIDGGVLGKGGRVEEVVAIALCMQCLEGLQLVRFARQLEIEAVHQFVVSRGNDANRETRLECCDTGGSPNG